MDNALSVSSAPLCDFQANLKILFNNSTDIEIIDHNILNKYGIHKFNQYAAKNAKDYSFQDCIQVDFGRFEAKHFDTFYGLT